MSESEDSGGMCGPRDFTCWGARGAGNISEGVSDAAESVAGSALESVAQSLADGAVTFLQMLTSWWMNTPAPDTEQPAVVQIQQDMGYFVAAFAIIGFLFGLARIILTMDPKKIMTTFAPIVTLIVVTGVYATGISLLLEAGDGTATWLLDRATEEEANLEVLAAPVASIGAGQIGVFLLCALLVFLGSVMNFLLMIFRDVTILVLLAFLPVIAASTGSQSGKQAFTKANGWLLALLLFKPIAAGIYALGLRMMSQDSEFEGADVAEGWDNYANAMTGMLILALAGLAMPALIKFVSPAAAAGAAAFSGGAAVGGVAAVAGGAAVIAGTGGAGAAAGAGSAAGASGGGGAAAGGGQAAASSGGGMGAAGTGGSGAAGSGAGAAGGSSGAPSCDVQGRC